MAVENVRRNTLARSDSGARHDERNSSQFWMQAMTVRKQSMFEQLFAVVRRVNDDGFVGERQAIEFVEQFTQSIVSAPNAGVVEILDKALFFGRHATVRIDSSQLITTVGPNSFDL